MGGASDLKHSIKNLFIVMNKPNQKYFYVYQPHLKSFAKVAFRDSQVTPPYPEINKSGLSNLTQDLDDQ